MSIGAYQLITALHITKYALMGFNDPDSASLGVQCGQRSSQIRDNLSMLNLNSWDFDIFQVPTEELPFVALHLFESLDLLEFFAIPPDACLSFLFEIEAKYHVNYYHNFRHAVDVAHAVYLLITTTEAKHYVDNTDKCAILLAALCHDLDHPGLTNSFLIATDSALAQIYNDRSVLENHHAALASKILNKSNGILSYMNSKDSKRIRSIIISTVLGTDMSKHSDILKMASDSMKNNEVFQCCTIDNQLLLMQMILKCADISNITKPFHIGQKWSALLLQEFCHQGDQERQLNIEISPFMDRNTTSLPSLTIRFSDYFAQPLFEMLSFMLPATKNSCLLNLTRNRKLWESLENEYRENSLMGKSNTLTGESTLEINKCEESMITSDNVHYSKCVSNRDSVVRAHSFASEGRSLNMSFDGENNGAQVEYVACEIQRSPFARRILAILDSSLWQISMFLVTVYALFGEDLKHICFPKEYDPSFYMLSIISLCFFSVDLCGLSLVKPGYFLSTYFFLDFFASVSMIPEVLDLLSMLSIARTARAAKAGSRASRMLRFLRLFRVVKILKFGFNFKRFPCHEDTEIDNERENEGAADEDDLEKPSAIWNKMNESLSAKLVVGAMAMFIVIPLLDVPVSDNAVLAWMDALQSFCLGSISECSFLQGHPDNGLESALAMTWEAFLDFNDAEGYEMLYAACRPDCTVQWDDIVPLYGSKGHVAHEFREENEIFFVESNEIAIAGSKCSLCESIFSLKLENIEQAGYNVILTIFLIFLLGLWSLVISKDADYILIKPIENLTHLIKSLANDPLSFVRTQQKQQGLKHRSSIESLYKNEGEYETTLLASSFLKIANLLYVALGEAGMQIVKENLKEGSEFSPMIPGKRIQACFGFCDIRQFTDTTECLQEKVMVFVNHVADIVHDAVVKFGGAPNKNIGDAFLLVWKKNSFSDIGHTQIDGCAADRALKSFITIISNISSSKQLAIIASDSAILHRIPSYEVRLGYGLHIGWAIEGAIGSRHKVDPSYLSPHVNLSSRLEAATKQYGVNLLMSEDFFLSLEDSILIARCRKIDRVTVKGSIRPVSLYTYDYGIDRIDHSLSTSYSEYRSTFDDAVEKYIAGNWPLAISGLKRCVELWCDDVPARVLIEYIRENGSVSPVSWHGFRELTEK